MNVLEFIVCVLAIIVIGLWGIFIIMGKYNMIDKISDDKDDKDKGE